MPSSFRTSSLAVAKVPCSVSIRLWPSPAVSFFIKVKQSTMVLFVTIIILVLPFHYFVDKGHMFLWYSSNCCLYSFICSFSLAMSASAFAGPPDPAGAPAFAFVYAEIHSSAHRAVSAVRVPLPHPKSRQESVHTFHYKCQCRSFPEIARWSPPSFQQAVRLRVSKLLSFQVHLPVRGFCSFPYALSFTLQLDNTKIKKIGIRF